MNKTDREEQPQIRRPEFFSNKSNEPETEKLELKERSDLGLDQGLERAFEDRIEISKSNKDFSEIGGQAAPAPVAVPAGLSEREKAIEAIMAGGLEDIFLSLSPDKQAEFKKSGEETAQKINELLGKAKVKIKKIVDLLRKWLSLLPGAGRFFIEQESKIRADKIARLKG